MSLMMSEVGGRLYVEQPSVADYAQATMSHLMVMISEWTESRATA